MAANVDGEYGGAGGSGPGLLTAVRRYPLIVLVFVLIGIAVAAGATLAAPTHYTAHADLVLGDDNDVTVYRNVQPPNAVARAQTAATALRSDEVFDRASALLDHRISSNKIEGSVTIAPSDSAAMVTISATRNKAQAASDVANAVAKAYIDLSKTQAQDDADRAQATLKRQQEDGLSQLDAVQANQAKRATTIAKQYASITILSDRARLVQGALNSDSIYQALTRQADRLSQTLADLRQTLTENRVDTQLVTGGVDTLYPAAKPKNETGSSLRRNLLVGGVLGLLVGVIVAWRRLDKRRGLEGDLVADVLGAPMLGHLRSTRELRNPTAVVDLSPGRALSDDLRVLASAVVLDLRKRDLAAALITSAEPREGRTVLALNLAAAAQASGHDVVLVDGDVRHPDLTSRLDLGSTTGLRDLMTGASLTRLESVPYGDGGSLPVIPVGERTGITGTDAPDLVRADGSRPAAIVDSAALGEDPFALGLAASGWAGLVVVVSNVATLEDLGTLRSRAELVGSPILGFVLNEHRARRRRPKSMSRSADASRYQGKRRGDPAPSSASVEEPASQPVPAATTTTAAAPTTAPTAAPTASASASTATTE